MALALSAPAVHAGHLSPISFFRKLINKASGYRKLLSPQQVDQFTEQGYVVFDPQVTHELMDRAFTELQIYFTKTEPGTPGYHYSGRVFDAWRVSPAVKRIATNERVLAALRQLYGREALPFQTLNFPVGTEQEVHSDTIHFNSAPGGFMAGVWIAFEDMDMDNGPLIYYPGSHKLPEYNIASCHKPAIVGSYENYPHLLDLWQRAIAKNNLQPSYATVKKGQAFIWAANLLHGGSPRRDRHRSRHSQVTHYFFKGCRYFTPLFSEGEEVYWRDPEWVTWTDTDQKALNAKKSA